MNYVYLVLIIISMSMQNVLKKCFITKTSGGTYFFSAFSSLSAAVFFLLSARNLSWNMEILPYALGMAASYSITVVFSFLATQYGSLALTSLMLSYSLLIPTGYGLVFLNESVSKSFILGILLLIISIILINQKEAEILDMLIHAQMAYHTKTVIWEHLHKKSKGMFLVCGESQHRAVLGFIEEMRMLEKCE